MTNIDWRLSNLKQKMAYYNLSYTYMQAVEKVEKATGGRVVVVEGKEKTNQHASYHIYTAENVYLFNNETGDFVVYERDK